MFASEHEATQRYFQLAELTDNKLATLFTQNINYSLE
jgi:rubrerythrin